MHDVDHAIKQDDFLTRSYKHTLPMAAVVSLGLTAFAPLILKDMTPMEYFKDIVPYVLGISSVISLAATEFTRFVFLSADGNRYSNKQER